jgi:hypothetical protein
VAAALAQARGEPVIHDVPSLTDVCTTTGPRTNIGGRKWPLRRSTATGVDAQAELTAVRGFGINLAQGNIAATSGRN